MESSSIELTVRYCRDLKSFNFFQKQSLFITVAIRSDEISKKPGQNQRQKTPNDEDGDGNPEWNHEVKFDIDEALLNDPDHIFFHFEVHANVMVLGDKIIGEAHVPLKDLVDGRSNGIVRFVNYELRGLDGKVNGMLNFSYKINRKGGTTTGAELVSIDGYSVIHQPSSEIRYPKVEVESDNPPIFAIQYPSIDSENPTASQVQHTSHEVRYPPSKVQHPSKESSNPSTEALSQVHHTSHEAHYPQTKVQHPSMESAQVQHTFHDAQHQPQEHSFYYTPPPSHIHLPPPPMFPHHPPPPHVVHGGFFHPPPPPPPPMFHWQCPNNHDSSRGWH